MTQSIPLDRANVSGEYSSLRPYTTKRNTPYRKRMLTLGNKLLQVQRLFAMLNKFNRALSKLTIH